MAMSPRLLRPVASGFNPKSLAGLAVWLDASKSSSVTLDGNGKVSTWSDLSGNGRDATQTTANNRATYTAAGFNGKNCLTFDGSNASSRMVLGDLSAVFPTFGEVIIAYDANDTAYSIYTTRNNEDAFTFGGSMFPGTFIQTRFSRAGTVPTTGSGVVSARASGTSYTLRVDGIQSYVQTGVTFAGGDEHTIANRPPSTNTNLAFNGKIGEILLFNADIGATARSAVERYLKQKWGTP